MAFPKVKIVIGTLIAFVCLLATPRLAYAQCLINIPDWSASQVTTCLEPGGTIGLVGSYGNFGNIYRQTAEIVSQYNQTQSGSNRVTLEYRLYNDARPSTAEEIQSVIAIIQQNSIGAPVMLRINNEWTDSYVWPGMDFGSRVSNYLQTQYLAWQTIRDAGGGIVLVDGMLDYWSGVNMDQVINAINAQIQTGQYPGWNSWADTFDVLAINGYFEPGDFGRLGNYQLNQVLSRLPPGKPWRFSEFGYKLPGQRPTYDNPDLLEKTIIDLVSWLANNPSYAQTFAGFNIFTRDPHNPDSANMAAAIMEIVKRNPNLGSALAALENFGLQDPAAFQAWLEQLLQDGILVECTDDGGIVIGYAPTLDQCQLPFQMPETPANTCTAQGAEQSGLFRPAPCKNCSLDVPYPTNACAESFNLIRPETWTCGDLTGCPDPLEGRYFIKQVDWNADFFLNTQDTKVPFAGYRKIITDDEDKVKNLNYYLADYFEGTTLLDGEPYDPTDPEQVREGIMNAGVFRKLAPLEVQDRLREQMILSGLNYEVSDGKTTKHMQDFWVNPPLPPARYPSGYFPPDRNNPDYLELYDRWIQSDWGKLWQRIPLFNREDAPGKVKLAIEHDPGLLEPNTPAGRQMEYYSAEFPMAFPHLARVYEATDNLNHLLTPTIQAARAEALVPETGEPVPCGSIFGEGIQTALGCMPTTAVGLASWVVNYGSSLAGGLAFLLMGYGAFLFITSAGDEEKIAQGKTIFTAAIIGLLIIIGSVFILRLIIVQVLKIPGFAQSKPAASPKSTQITDSTSTATSPTLLAYAEPGPTLGLPGMEVETATEPKLLAQGAGNPQQGSSPVRFEVVITGEPQPVGGGRYRIPYEVKIYSNRSDRGIHVRAYVNGQDLFGNVVVVDQSWGPFVVVDQWLPDLFAGEGGTVSLELFAQVDDAGEFLDPQALQNCSLTLSGGQITSNCDLSEFLQQPPEPAGCTNAHDIDGECSGNDPQEDRNPNDPPCCDAQAHVDIPDYRIVAYSSYSDYADACLCDPLLDEDCDPGARHEVQMTRKVSVKLRVPYLEEIWEDSTKDELGFFNLFRPAHFPLFPDSDALSNIRYQLLSPETQSDPPVGELYYPYLGGINQAKKCISEQFLVPRALQPETNYCQFWEDYLKFQSRYQEGTTGFSVDDGSELNNLECQNDNFEISDSAKQSALATVNQSWPENLLEERWDSVVDQAQAHGWNPACVVALWVEESGASDLATTGAKHSLGCEGATSSDPNTNLNESLDCFFSRQDHEYYRRLVPGSREWWLVYVEGPNNSGVFDGP